VTFEDTFTSKHALRDGYEDFYGGFGIIPVVTNLNKLKYNNSLDP